jgi:hypothetical protein
MPAPSATTSNPHSASNSKTAASAGERVQAGKLNIPVHQAVSLNPEHKHEILIVPSSSNPSFGGFFTIDIRELNVVLHDIMLQFQLGPVIGTGLTGAFQPAYFFFQRIEILQSSVVMDTIYSNQQFIEAQLSETDEQRLSSNNAAGNYASLAQRTLLSSQTSTNTYYVNLKSYINQTHPHLLTSAHNIQLKIYMDTLSSAFTTTAGTLTSCNINACNAICRVVRLDPASSQQRLGDMTIRNHHAVMHDLHYGTFNVAAGVTSTTIILAPIVGNVSRLLFTVRANTSGNQQWVYTQLASWALQNSASTNIVGGQALPASFCTNILNKDWIKSSYTSETSFGVNNQYANVYMWCHSSDPISAHGHGQMLGSYRYTGVEQMLLNFPAPLAAQVQVDVYAMVEGISEVSPNHVKKLTI